MEHVNKDLSVDLLGPNRHHFGFLSGVFFFNVTVDFSGLLKTTLSLYLVERQQKESRKSRPPQHCVYSVRPCLVVPPAAVPPSQPPLTVF